jgi:predicted HTH transcriptional regulator
MNHPEFTSQQIAKEIGKTSRTVETYQAKLKDAGIIERKGPKLGGHWEIIEEK